MDQNTFTLIYAVTSHFFVVRAHFKADIPQDRVDVFKVSSVDANNDEVDADIAKAILQSVIARMYAHMLNDLTDLL